MWYTRACGIATHTCMHLNIKPVLMIMVLVSSIVNDVVCIHNCFSTHVQCMCAYMCVYKCVYIAVVMLSLCCWRLAHMEPSLFTSEYFVVLCQVFEMNSSTLRTSKAILEQLKESTQSQQVTNKPQAGSKSIQSFFSNVRQRAERKTSTRGAHAAGTV